MLDSETRIQGRPHADSAPLGGRRLMGSSAMPDPRHAVVRVCYHAPLILVRHLRAPDQARAAGEVAEIQRHMRQGGRMILLLIDETLPPPSFAAIKEFRVLFDRDSSLEHLVMITPGASGFAYTIATSTAMQALRMTRLAGKLSTHHELMAACMKISELLEQAIDVEAIAELFDELAER